MILYWQVDNLLLFINLFHIIQMIFHHISILLTLFQSKDWLKRTHLAYLRIRSRFWVDLSRSHKRKFVQGVTVFQRNHSFLLKVTLESHIKVSHLILQNVRDWSRVWDDTFHQGFIEVELDFRDDGSEGLIQQLNHLFWVIFPVFDEYVMAFPFFSTALH